METRDVKYLQLTETTVRICPACGVVNPSGPSGGCPHLQLIRFEGVGEELENTLSRVAAARRTYAELIAQLKLKVMAGVSRGEGRVETPHNVKADQVDTLYQASGKPGQFALSHVAPVKTKPMRKRPAKKRAVSAGISLVDPRQLNLLALSTPKGDA